MDKFLCWDCGNDVPLTDPKIIDHVKSSGMKTIEGTYLYVCSECGRDED